MRNVEIDDKTYQVSGLTRKQIGSLKAKGYPINRWNIALDLAGMDKDPELETRIGNMFDEILEAAVATDGDGGLDIMALTPAAERELFNAIVIETYGDEDEEKNSSGSGNGTQTKSE